MNFLDTKREFKQLIIFTHRETETAREKERESPKSSREGVVQVERWCWVNFQCRGVPLIWIIGGQGPIALAVGAGGVVCTFFFSSIVSFFFLPLWETARYRLK